MACVYEHRCTVSGKSYIGKTTRTAEYRWTRHINAALCGGKYAFSSAIRKYGPEAFVMIVHATGLTEREAGIREIELIAQLGTRSPYGYNRTAGGDGVSGLVFSAASREQMRQSHLGKKASEETKAKMSRAGKGSKASAVEIASKHNQKTRLDNVLGLKGIVLDKRRGTYRAVIKTDGRPIYLGSYRTAEEAELAYWRAKPYVHKHWEGGDALLDPKDSPLLERSRRVRLDSVSGLLGVQPHGDRWRARYKQKHLGLFETPELAHAAVQAAIAAAKEK